MTDPSISCVYSCDKTADERIKEIVEARDDKKNIVVVSDDREIYYFARDAHCTAMGVEEFLGKNIALKMKHARKDQTSGDAAGEISISDMTRIDKELRKKWLE